jgi:hypothetical protein
MSSGTREQEVMAGATLDPYTRQSKKLKFHFQWYITGIPFLPAVNSKKRAGSHLFWIFYNTFWRYLAVLTVNINFFSKI